MCHHIVRHQGNASLFWSGPYASLCKSCHDIDEGRVEAGGKARAVADKDGWPVGAR